MSSGAPSAQRPPRLWSPPPHSLRAPLLLGSTPWPAHGSSLGCPTSTTSQPGRNLAPSHSLNNLLISITQRQSFVLKILQLGFSPLQSTMQVISPCLLTLQKCSQLAVFMFMSLLPPSYLAGFPCSSASFHLRTSVASFSRVDLSLFGCFLFFFVQCEGGANFIFSTWLCIY